MGVFDEIRAKIAAASAATTPSYDANLDFLSNASALVKNSMGSDDASINPLTYATTFQTPQGNYTFVSEDFINKGVKSGDTTYVNKNFLDPATLSNFLSNATAVDLSKAKASGITSIPTWGEWVTQRLGQSPKGYLVKGDAPFDSSGFVDSFKNTFIQEMRDAANIKGTGPAASTGLNKFWSIIPSTQSNYR